MKETLITLLIFYSLYVGYFIGVNRESWKPEKNFFYKIMAILFCYCVLWLFPFFDIIIFIKSKFK